MASQPTGSDLAGQPVFVGMDVHLKQWKVTVRAGGLELRQFSTSPDPDGLARHLRRTYPGAQYHTAYEAGFCGFWIHRRLEALGMHNTVAHAPDIPTTQKERTNKEDRRDSRKLARELEAGSLEPLYIPDLRMEELRSLCRARHRLSIDGRRLKNRIKSLFHLTGIELPLNCEMKHWSCRFLDWVAAQASGDTSWAATVKLWLRALRDQRTLLNDTTRTLRQRMRQDGDPDLVALLTTIPGVGYITAATLYCEIIDIRRFAQLEHLASFVGLVPSTRSTGDHPNPVGLTPRANRFLRAMITEAAWVAVRKDPALLGSFVCLSQKMRKTKAIIRIARKLLNRIRCVWLRRTPYITAVIGREEEE